MFNGAKSFNSDISSWDLSSSINTRQMFYEATSFNSDISHWDLSSSRDTTFMFTGAVSFNQDISRWVTTAEFREPIADSQCSISTSKGEECTAVTECTRNGYNGGRCCSSTQPSNPLVPRCTSCTKDFKCFQFHIEQGFLHQSVLVNFSLLVFLL